MSSTSEKIREFKLSRMRLGQAVGDKCPLLSDPDIEITMVPLTEAEFYQCFEIISSMEAPDNIVGAALRDRRNQNEILWRAIRDPENLDEKAFETREEMMELLDVGDTNHLIDFYMEISESINPVAHSFTDEELDEIKKALSGVALNDLSGRQWFALKRFLLSLGLELLPASSLGSTPTNLLTTTNDEEKYTLTA